MYALSATGCEIDRPAVQVEMSCACSRKEHAVSGIEEDSSWSAGGWGGQR